MNGNKTPRSAEYISVMELSVGVNAFFKTAVAYNAKIAFGERLIILLTNLLYHTKMFEIQHPTKF